VRPFAGRLKCEPHTVSYRSSPSRLSQSATSFRGHGASDKATAGFTDKRLAKDALAVADAAGAQTFTAAGFSYPATR
jgi:hypothetical protein